jgi:phosphopantetheine attachment domain protein
MNKEFETKIIDIVSMGLENIDLSETSYDTELISMGLSSISFIAIIVALEEEFQITVSNENLILSKMDTLQKIISVVESEILFQRGHI